MSTNQPKVPTRAGEWWWGKYKRGDEQIRPLFIKQSSDDGRLFCNYSSENIFDLFARLDDI